MNKKPTRSLQLGQVVALALVIADREGLAAVSFRRLADELGVTAMALYHHVQDKAALLGQMTDRLLAEVVVPAERDRADWRKALRVLLGSFVSVRERHPCTADLLQSHFSGSTQAPRLTELALQILCRAGFDPPSALPIVQQLATLLVVRTGSPAAAASGSDPPTAELRRLYPLLSSIGWSWSRPDQDRELGIDLLIHGIEGLLRRKKRGGSPTSR